MTSFKKIVSVAVLAPMAQVVITLSTFAGVTVTQNTSITNWSANALIATVANPPGVNATVAENNFGTLNVAQTFTATTNIVLTNIQMYVSGTAQTFNLHLFDLGTGHTAGNPSPYVAGADLFSGIQLAFGGSANGFVINLAFTGADQVLLGAGHKYAFELEKVSGGPMSWYRTGSSTYSGGDAYRDRGLINGTQREFALAVFGTPTTNSPPPPPALCTVNWNDMRQRIDGFGASSAWQGSWTTAWADMFFSTNSGTGVSKNGTNYSYTGIALSLLRNHINPDGTTSETSIMQMAQARGARVWSTPWSPPASMKSNGNVNNGGSLLVGSYQAYANQLASYVYRMQNDYGVNLHAVSVQNEPDQTTSYESCVWTGQQIHDFVPFLYNALVASNVASTKILIAEDSNWRFNLVTNTMNDPTTSNMVGILAAHSYGSSASAVNKYGKALWETEDSILQASGGNTSISNGIYWAQEIHNYMTVAEANAWHFWWLIIADPNNANSNEGLCDTNRVPAKRMYTLGNFSRFVRPNYHRIGVVNLSGAQVSAYRDTNAGNFAIVAINSSVSASNVTFNLTNFATVTNVTPWITSTNLSLANQSAVMVSNSSFTYSLPGRSVVTFVGQAITNPPNSSPILASVADQIINAGVILNVTNEALDADAPPQTLTFDLLSINPTNATLDTNSGVFTWRPMISQGDTTNLIVVKVSDSGTPVLSDTNSFAVVVNPVTQPMVDSISVGGGQVSLVLNGQQGPDYAILTSTNLTDWLALVTTNSPVPPVTITDTNFSDFMRFYRIQLGP